MNWLVGVSDGLTMSQRTVVNEEAQPSLCAIQLTPTPRVEMHSSKWQDLFIGVCVLSEKYFGHGCHIMYI